MTPSTALVWFRRDLRLHDHPALAAATERATRVVPLFVVDTTLLGGRFASANRTWFMLGSASALRASLREIGSDLVVRVGDPREIVPAVAREIGASDVFVSRDHSPYGRARDRTVADALADGGIAWHARRGNLVHEPEAVATQEGRPFSVYSPFRRAWELLDRPATIHAPTALGPAPSTTGSGAATPGSGVAIPGSGRDLGLAAGDIPTLADLGLGDAPTASLDLLPEPGEAAARRRLERWLERGVEGYDANRDRMDLVDGTSRLSADLRFGLISPLEVVERALGPGDGRRVFVNEIVWREFYANVLFHRPSVRQHAFREEFERLPWAIDEAGVAAWREGRTGFPIVDAAMRQLAGSGWMHNRARMIAASFLTKDLLSDWRTGEAHFMRHLVDGDVASNNGGWQWSASTGTDPQPYFRIFNPASQGRRYDPDGDYVRRWVPELARVPAARIHAPAEMSVDEQAAAACRIGIDYPAPIVDHAEARVRALSIYEAARSEAARRTS